MEKLIKQGDLVESTKGHDLGDYFLVTDCDGREAVIINGKSRKINSPKRKNIKHLKKVSSASLYDIAEKIKNGEAVGNKRLWKLIVANKEKTQED